jgi:hypothetical protein
MQMAKLMVATAIVAGVVTGCRDAESANSGGGAAASPTQTQAGLITGRVTMPDGKTPPTGDIKDISISIVGVSEAAEKVSYSPAVKPDGTYRQKVSGGQYSFSTATITVNYEGGEYRLPLEPVGNLWNKNRDVADGIVQEFIWHPKGPTPYGKANGLDIGNHTHWYGISIGFRPEGYRNDINQAPPKIPDKSKITVTLKPKGRAIDGSEPKEPVVIERVHDGSSYASMDINDLLPAPYEMSATVSFPDGTSKPLVLFNVEDRNYKPTVPITVQKDNITGGFFKMPITYAIE